MTTNYKPRAGSVAARVIEFLSSNLDEELSRTDVAAKYDCSLQSVATLLAPAIEHGLLSYTRNDDLELVYRSTSKARSNPFAALAGHTNDSAATLGPEPTPEILASLKVDNGVPLKPVKQGAHEKWNALFERLTHAGQSVQVPRHWKKSLALAAARINKVGKDDTSRPLYRVANDHPPSPHARVWRTR